MNISLLLKDDSKQKTEIENIEEVVVIEEEYNYNKTYVEEVEQIPKTITDKEFVDLTSFNQEIGFSDFKLIDVDLKNFITKIDTIRGVEYVINENELKDKLKINTNTYRYGKNLIIFKDGKYIQLAEGELLKIIKYEFLKVNKKIKFTDTFIVRLIDIIGAYSPEYPYMDKIIEIEKKTDYKIISDSYIYSFKKDYETNKIIEIEKEINIGQYYNYVSIVDLNLGTDDIEKQLKDKDNIEVGESFIDTALNKIFVNDKELKRYMQELAGYCMLYGFIQPNIFILQGNGKNGKSLYANILKTIIGQQNTCSIEFSEINPQNLATFERCLVNLPTELSERNLPENLLKTLSGGESTTANEKYKEPRTIFPKAKQLALTNPLPVIRDASLGFWRRIQIIPFLYTVKKEEEREEKEFLEIFYSNRELLCKWALRGLIRLLENKGYFSTCIKIESKTQEYRMENSNALMFFNNEFIKHYLLKFFVKYHEILNDPTKKIIKFDNDTDYRKLLYVNDEDIVVDFEELHNVYRMWCAKVGHRSLSSRELRRKLEEEQPEFIELTHQLEWFKSSGKTKIKVNKITLYYKYKLECDKGEMEDTFNIIKKFSNYNNNNDIEQKTLFEDESEPF